MSLPEVNNYFKIYRNQIFPFNDGSDASTSRALNSATILSRGGKITVWKRFLGMPEFLRVVGEVHVKDRKRALPPLPSPAEPEGGADDYPSPESEESEVKPNGVFP